MSGSSDKPAREVCGAADFNLQSFCPLLIETDQKPRAQLPTAWNVSGSKAPKPKLWGFVPRSLREIHPIPIKGAGCPPGQHTSLQTWLEASLECHREDSNDLQSFCYMNPNGQDSAVPETGLWTNMDSNLRHLTVWLRNSRIVQNP